MEPDNGMMNITTLRIGGQATYACLHGYSLTGPKKLECLASGSWSGWPPVCVEVDCKQPLEVGYYTTCKINRQIDCDSF